VAIRLKIAVPDNLALTFDTKLVRQVFGVAGQEIAKGARQNIRAMFNLDHHNPKSKMPLLANSIRSRVFKSGTGVAVRASTPVALWLDQGAVGGGGRGRKGSKAQRKKRGEVVTQRILVGRLFMEKAVDDAAAAGLGDRIKDAVMRGLELTRKK
jgi:hypothetical protein